LPEETLRTLKVSSAFCKPEELIEKGGASLEYQVDYKKKDSRFGSLKFT
jgi:hypothetical protein